MFNEQAVYWDSFMFQRQSELVLQGARFHDGLLNSQSKAVLEQYPNHRTLLENPDK